MMCDIGINILVALMGMASRKFHELQANGLAEMRDQTIEVFSYRLRRHGVLYVFYPHSCSASRLSFQTPSA
jgi:hypothetical protein